jgi:hypothetical protein
MLVTACVTVPVALAAGLAVIIAHRLLGRAPETV